MPLTAAQTAAVVAANDDIGISFAGLVRRVVVVAECGLCQMTHPEDHTCDAKFGALLQQAGRQISKATRSLARSETELSRPPRARADGSH